MSLLRAAALILAFSISASAANRDWGALGLKLKKDGKFELAESAFKRALTQEPGNVDALEQLATIQGWLKKYDESIASWEDALRLAPRRSDFRIGMARVLYWKGDYEKALRQLESAQVNAVEALSLQGDVLAAAGRSAEARGFYTRALALAPDDQDVVKKLNRTQDALLWRIDAGVTLDYFNRQRGTEYDAYTQVGYSFSKKGAAWVRYDYQRQFKLIDRSYQFGAAYRAARPLLLMADYAVTPNSQVRSRNQLNLGAEFLLPYVSPLFGYRRLNYADGNIHTYTPGLRLQLVPWLNNEFRYGISKNLNATKTYSYQIRANFFIGEILAPYLSFAHGKEAIPPLSAAISDYYSAGVVWNVARAWGLRADYSYEERQGFYLHHSAGSGVTYKF